MFLTAFFFSMVFVQQSHGAIECGDVNADGKLVASDALMVLKKAVGIDQTLQCPCCAAEPSVEIIGLNPNDIYINGRAYNFKKGQKIVLWAMTNMWYVQPFIDEPFTDINTDGTWRNYTHGWVRMVALLVDPAVYVPGSTRTYHPSSDDGVIAWTEYPAPSRALNFSGFRWEVKIAEDFVMGPGPNYFSESAENSWVDGSGRLHLKTTERDGKWMCAEVVLDRALGYGTYEFQLVTDTPNTLDANDVFAGFTYETTEKEIDIEFSRALMGPPNFTQYVVQPWYKAENMHRFPLPEGANTTHRFVWGPASVGFVSWKGFDPYPPPPGTAIQQWDYEGPDIPPPDGQERMRFNLWLFNGNAPENGVGSEVIIKSFTFTPFE